MMDRSDVAAIADRALDILLESRTFDPQIVLRTGSGTTGSPPMLIPRTLDTYAYPIGEWVFKAQRILICSGPRSVRFMESCLQYNNAAAPKRFLALDVKDIHQTSLFEDFAPDTINGYTSFILQVGRNLGKAAAGVRMIVTVGEKITAEMEKHFKELFPNAVLCSGYSSSETGGLSKETCGFAPRHAYHPRDDVKIEIVDADETGVGDLVMSRRIYGGLLIDQYKMGDAARLRTTPCECGETITFEILGRRNHDYIKLNGALLIQAEFDRVAGLFPAVIDDYRAIASAASDLKGQIHLKVYSKQEGSAALRKEVEDQFAQELFVTHDKTLADLVVLGYFEPMTVEWVDNPFPISNKAIRLSRV